MEKFVFTIEEILRRTVVINAPNEEDAYTALENALDEERLISLTYDDFAEREIKDETAKWLEENKEELKGHSFEEYETEDGCDLKALPNPIISKALEYVYGTDEKTEANNEKRI